MVKMSKLRVNTSRYGKNAESLGPRFRSGHRVFHFSPSRQILLTQRVNDKENHDFMFI